MNSGRGRANELLQNGCQNVEERWYEILELGIKGTHMQPHLIKVDAQFVKRTMAKVFVEKVLRFGRTAVSSP